MNSVLSTPLILGAGGRLGRQLEEVLMRRQAATVAATRSEIDITDYFRMREEFERLQPSLVINCAALAKVDLCESRPELAQRVNAEGAANAARACRKTGARFIHISTDQVFDGGKKELYVEDDAPSPLSHYGTSKLEGEQRVLRELPEALVVRTSWLFGPGGGDFVESVLKSMHADGRVSGVTDQIACPTYIPDLAEALLVLAEKSARGCVHFVNAGPCNRFQFACQIADLARIPGDYKRERLRWQDLRLPARRPAYSALSTSRYTSVTSRTPREWRAALAEQLSGARPEGLTDAPREPA